MVNRIIRIIVGLLAPAPIAVVLFFIYISFGKPLEPNNELVASYIIWVIGAYIFIFVQSIIYTISMEVINNIFKNNLLVVSLSGFMGTISGSIDIAAQDINLNTLSIIGCITGLIVGYLLRSLYQKSINQPYELFRSKNESLH